ncbi:MAG: SIR2 family protein [Pontiella sp.]
MPDRDRSAIAIGLAKDAFADKRLVLFIGAGISQSCGYPGWAELVRPLAERSGCKLPDSPSADDLVRAFQEVETELGRVEIYRHYKNVLNDPHKKPGSLHLLIARSELDTIYTTNYDSLLEDCIKQHNRRANVVLTAANRSSAPAGAVNIIKLCGDVQNHADNIITNADYDEFDTRKADLITPLKSDLQGKVLLFVGYSLGDPFIQRRIYECFQETNGCATHIVLALDWPDEKVTEWRSCGLKIIDQKPESLDEGGFNYTAPVENVLREIFNLPELEASEDELLGSSTTGSSHLNAPESVSLEAPLNRIERKLDQILERNISQPLSGRLNDQSDDERILQYLQEDFEDAKTTLEAGHYDQARTQFSRLHERASDDNFRQRMQFNIGLSHYFAGELDDANRHFRLGLDLVGDEKRMAIFGSLSALLENRPEDVLPLLEPYGDGDEDVVRIKSNALAQIHGADAAIAFLQGILNPSIQVRLALADALSSADHFNDAERVLRDLMTESKDWLIRFNLGNAILFPIMQRFKDLHMTPFSLSRGDREKLEEAATYLRLAEPHLETTERTNSKLALWINLSAVESILGRPAEGILAAEKALEICPEEESITVLQNLYVAYGQVENHARATEIAQQLSERESSQENLARWASALFLNNQYSDALVVIDRWGEEHADDLSDEYYCHRSRCLQRLERLGLAQQALTDGLERHPQSAIIQLEQASLYILTNQVEDADQAFALAAERADNSTRYIVRQEYGRFLFSQSRWEEAKQHFLHEGEESLHCPHIDLYLACFSNLKQIDDGYHLLKDLVESGIKGSPLFYEVAAMIERARMDIGSALLYAERAFGMEPSANRVHMLMELYSRTNQKEQASEIACSYCQKHPDEFGAQFNAAHALYSEGKYGEALAYAERALAIEPESMQLQQLLFQHTFLPASVFEPSEQQQALISQAFPFLANHSDSPFISIPADDGCNALLSFLQEQSDQAGRICSKYEVGETPLCVTAKMLGRSLMDVYDACRDGQLGGLRMADGTYQEQDHELDIAQNASLVTLDLSALLSLQLVGCLDIIRGVFPEAQVPWPIREALEAELNNMATMPPSGGMLHYNNGAAQYQEYPPTYFDEKRRRLEELIAFLDSGITLVGIENAEAVDSDAFEMMGADVLAPLFCAQPLFSDDLLLRHMVGRNAFCSQAFLKTALLRGVISSDQYEDAILTLMDNNYHFVAEHAKTLWRALERNDFQSSAQLDRLLGRVHLPNIDKVTVCKIFGVYAGQVMLVVGANGSGRVYLITQVIQQIEQIDGPLFLEVLREFLFRSFLEFLWAPSLIGGFYDVTINAFSTNRRMIVQHTFIQIVHALPEIFRQQGMWREYDGAQKMQEALALRLRWAK